ncbi:MAG TPA: hypothetical protein VEK56_00600, partial [Vicinamibacterales bacterium]|nr:hypothetical protein [Vicinamibacterales bacterium]
MAASLVVDSLFVAAAILAIALDPIVDRLDTSSITPSRTTTSRRESTAANCACPTWRSSARLSSERSWVGSWAPWPLAAIYLSVEK